MIATFWLLTGLNAKSQKQFFALFRPLSYPNIDQFNQLQSVKVRVEVQVGVRVGVRIEVRISVRIRVLH